MNKHLLSKSTCSMLIGTLGAIGSVVIPFGSAQAAESFSRINSLQFGELPTVYPGSSQAMAEGARGPMRSEMTSEAGYSASSWAAQSELAWKHSSLHSGLLAEQPTEYPTRNK
jgi:hypothetical protein